MNEINMGTLFWVLTIIVCGIFLVISWRVKGQANESFSHYAIGGSSFPMLLIFFTQFATIMGAGNFIGHAGSGYENGVSWLAFIAGEQGAKIVFALVFAGLAGRLTYNTMPEMIDDLLVGDKVTRVMCGVLGTCIMIAWVGGQGKAFGEIFAVFTGVDPLPIIFLFSLIFIIYTVLGGVYSVVWTDLFQGILCVVFGILFYTFLTGLVGVLVAQTYWQRCFACKDGRTARNGLLYSGIICVVMTMLTALVGLIIMTLNQDLDADSAMPWFMMCCTPPLIGAAIFVLILCAGMSSADSCLNSAAVLVVNDLIRPFAPQTDDRRLVRYAKAATVVIGVAASVCAVYASSIISLFSRAYAMAGAGIAPLLCIGFFWRERRTEGHVMGKRNTKVTPWGARTGIVVGTVVSQLPVLGISATLVGVVAASVCIVAVSLLTRRVPKGPVPAETAN